MMGRIPFYRTTIELEHHFLNIKQNRTCSSNDDRTRMPEFWLRMKGHQTKKAFTRFTKLFIEQLRKTFF